ncbi:MAG: DegT/DnrJ/EryC1/StrS family aminotransferase [Candidatus Hodarchaeales archaeon]|jgi:perosamine synthetase
MKKFAQPEISEEEISHVSETIRSRSFVEGINARNLEKEFAEFVGAKHAICTVNGTAALHLAMEGMNISPGTEMITPAFTFIASANAICFGGNIPIFCDIHPDTFNIDPEKIIDLVNPNTKAIVPVHIFGLPCDMKAINEIAEDNDLKIIEDACQAHGGRIDGKHVGTFGDVGCFSFYATKNMITGEGGMVVTDNDDLANRMRSIKNHGRGLKGGYHHHLIAYNFRLADPLAAIGLIQMRKLPKMLKQRKKNAESIRKTLIQFDQLHVQSITPGVTHGHYICAPVITHPDLQVEKVIDDLKSKGIASRQIYSMPCHQQPTYLEGIKEWRWSKYVNYPDYSTVKLPVTERIASNHFEIPIHTGVSEKEIIYIQNALSEIFS